MNNDIRIDINPNTKFTPLDCPPQYRLDGSYKHYSALEHMIVNHDAIRGTDRGTAIKTGFPLSETYRGLFCVYLHAYEWHGDFGFDGDTEAPGSFLCLVRYYYFTYLQYGNRNKAYYRKVLGI